VTADLLAAAVLATVPLAYLLGALTVTQLIAVELAIGSCRVLFRPAYSSHLTDVVRREELTQASGHLRTAESGATLLGPGLGGLLIQLVTAPLAVAIDAASFVVSAVCLRRLRSPERERASSARPRHLRRELAEGLNAVLGDPSLRAIAGAAANLNLFGMLVMALFVVYATRSLGFTAGMVGAIVTLGGIGALSGAVLAPRVAARIGAGRTIVLATIVFSFGLFVFPLAAGPRWVELLVLCGGELVMGVAVMFFDVTASGVTLSRVPAELLGRVSACSGFITQGVKPLGALAGGVLGTTLGLREALWVAAVGAKTTMRWTVCSPLRWDAAGAQARCQSGSGGPLDALSEEVGLTSTRDPAAE